MVRDKTLERALDRLRKPGAELVLTYVNGGGSTTGRAYFIMPGGVRVSDATAQKLLEHPSVQPHSPGLLPGHWQAWRLASRKEWAR
jgi:hypothetical protein